MFNLNEIKGCFDFQEGMLLKDFLVGVVCMSRLFTQNLLEVLRRFPSLKWWELDSGNCTQMVQHVSFDRGKGILQPEISSWFVTYSPSRFWFQWYVGFILVCDEAIEVFTLKHSIFSFYFIIIYHHTNLMKDQHIQFVECFHSWLILVRMSFTLPRDCESMHGHLLWVSGLEFWEYPSHPQPVR